MKKLILVLTIVCGSVSYSQSLTPTVVASSGEFFSTSSASLSWTLGEVVIDTYIGSNNQLTQGFQQPEIRLVSVQEFESNITFSIYPNPTFDYVNFSAKNHQTDLSIIIFDMSGKELIRSIYSPNTNLKIDLSHVQSGIYLMQVTDGTTILKTLKIEKN